MRTLLLGHPLRRRAAVTFADHRGEIRCSVAPQSHLQKSPRW